MYCAWRPHPFPSAWSAKDILPVCLVLYTVFQSQEGVVLRNYDHDAKKEMALELNNIMVSKTKH